MTQRYEKFSGSVTHWLIQFHRMVKSFLIICLLICVCVSVNVGGDKTVESKTFLNIILQNKVGTKTLRESI